MNFKCHPIPWKQSVRCPIPSKASGKSQVTSPVSSTFSLQIGCHSNFAQPNRGWAEIEKVGRIGSIIWFAMGKGSMSPGLAQNGAIDLRILQRSGAIPVPNLRGARQWKTHHDATRILSQNMFHPPYPNPVAFIEGLPQRSRLSGLYPSLSLFIKMHPGDKVPASAKVFEGL